MLQEPSPTYWDYLRIVPLLDLQGGLGDDDAKLSEDELHFIIVHQVFELWFKLVLRELRLARDQFAADWVPERSLPNVVRHLRRVNEIFKLSAEVFGVLETLTPQDFLAFRAKLGESSGFQSFQMREIEMLLGLSAEERQRHTGGGDPLKRIEQAARTSPVGDRVLKIVRQTQSEKSLHDALHSWLYRTPIQGSTSADADDAGAVADFLRAYRAGLERYDARLAPDFDRFIAAEEVAEGDRPRTVRVRAAVLFIESYRDLPLLAWPNTLLETVVEMEELLVLWRSRHARMVERIIGRRPGTGGSAGVSYLDATAQYRVFHEFWTVRSVLIPRAYIPELKRREFYELVEDVRTNQRRT
jgi:tryptophan 2,3-dioxygenase